MINPPSLIHEFSLVYSKDPALKLPEDETEAERLLKVARETGKWDDLIADGKQPTVFQFRDLTRSEIGTWIGEQSHSSLYGRPLSQVEANDLAIRIAIRSVTNFGKYKVTRRKWNGLSLADPDIIDAIFEHAGGEPLVEFAGAILERAQNPIRPLS